MYVLRYARTAGLPQLNSRLRFDSIPNHGNVVNFDIHFSIACGCDTFRTFLLFWTTNKGNYVTRTRRLHLKTMPLILVSIILGPLGNVFLGKGMKGVGSVTSARIIDISPIATRVLTSGYIWLGIGCLMGFFVAHMLLLTWADYSYVQPATSLSYLSIAILSYLVLGEMISPLRWLGVIIICVGVIIVGRTSPSSTEGPEHA